MRTAARRIAKYLPPLLGIALLTLALMLSAYVRARDEAIAQLYTQERILAEQATTGIGDYLTYLETSLGFLSREESVVRGEKAGKELTRRFFASQAANMASITRMDERGVILYSFPDESVAGRDISAQAHVAKVLKSHRPVLSSVFRAVQGYDAVAYHYPVDEGGRFAGSIAILIPFATISRRYLEPIKVGASGYAILLDAEGTELFGPEPRRIGKSIYESGKEFPSVLAMARAIRAAGSLGSSEVLYSYPAKGLDGGPIIPKRAFFKTVPVADGWWTVLVTAPEEDAVAFFRGFRDRWILLFGIVLLLFSVWGALFLRSVLLTHREEERREARERVLEAERERTKALAILDAAIRQSPSAIIVANAPDGELAAANPAALAICALERPKPKGPGSPPTSLLASPAAAGAEEPRFLDSAACPDIARLVESAIHGESTKGELMRGDGAEGDAWFMVNAAPVRDEEGRITAAVAVLNDITALKHFESEILRLNAGLERTVAKRTAELQTTQKQLVLSEKLAVLGQLSASIAHQVNTPLGAIASASETIGVSLAEGLAGRFGRYAALSPEARRRYGELLELSVRRRFERPLDATARLEGRRLAAKELAERGLEEAAAKADLLADMGLLDQTREAAALVAEGGAAALEDLFLFAGLALSSRIIEEASERASSVVRALGYYVSGASGEEPTAIDLSAAIELALPLYEERFRRGVRLEKRLAAGLKARARPEGLAQVWSNLVLNALQAMAYSGDLSITTRAEGDFALVEVVDSGPGIAPELRQRIFEPFFTTKTAGEGSGLGLAVARRIVEAEGGDISFASEPGRTAFLVRLPLWREKRGPKTGDSA